ncbi:MAG: hypothetical protein ACXV76_08815 [Halobacteriota archaeon]
MNKERKKSSRREFPAQLLTESITSTYTLAISIEAFGAGAAQLSDVTHPKKVKTTKRSRI